ncbi:MAG: hypothetical protein OSA08_13085, partial [Arenicellales bacterium]|nr:hypothetical protein [Arenicellales bacterium]
MPYSTSLASGRPWCLERPHHRVSGIAPPYLFVGAQRETMTEGDSPVKPANDNNTSYNYAVIYCFKAFYRQILETFLRC